MGVMLANPCHPYIQRGYRPFVIIPMIKLICSAVGVRDDPRLSPISDSQSIGVPEGQ